MSVHATAPRVEHLGDDRYDEIVDVLCEAFHDYPAMRYFIGEADDYDRRLRLIAGYFTSSRLLRDYPVLGVLDTDGELLGAANVNPAARRPVPPALAELERELGESLGDDAMRRIDAFNAVGRRIGPHQPHYHLGMIGVRRSAAGAGHGRRLLEAVHALSKGDPASTGVGLTTEDPSNVPFYEHFGYRVVGEDQLGDLHTWVFFRPDDS